MRTCATVGSKLARACLNRVCGVSVRVCAALQLCSYMETVLWRRSDPELYYAGLLTIVALHTSTPLQAVPELPINTPV